MKTIYAMAALLALAGLSRAEKRYVAVPAVDKAAPSPLQIHIDKYEGSSNGELSIEVHNPTANFAEFDAQGLYFVPDENVDSAPQRVGAVGPVQVLESGAWRRKEKIAVPPSGSVKLKLDVYCIDSHRRSPHTGDRFQVATARMPRALSNEIAQKTRAAAAPLGSYDAPPAKAAIQSEVWSTRDKRWQKLEGEGAQERGK